MALFLGFLLCVTLFLFTPTLMAASPPLASIGLGESLGSAEIVRCHFDEGRIVVRFTEKLHVLRAGDELDGTGLRMVEITPEHAILTIRQSSPVGSLRLIRITNAGFGTIILREYATDPAALAGGSITATPNAPISSTAKAAPPDTTSSGG